ncbi:MAG: methionyl-tRNA formyltransferase [Clostridia bacterium]|nr:methionyl-tRNA formyltransferase [Clostridia bacterium]
MKIVYLGTPDFSVKPLESILNSRHEVLAVVTQPDKPVGRKAIITPCDVKRFAIEKGLKTLSYNKIRVEGVDDLKALNPDIMVTCAYGQILSREILDIPKYGVINVHASLLPKYRGSSPIQWSIINGETETGVTIMQTEEGVDTGAIISQQKTQILPTETAGELFDRLSVIGANLIVKTLDDIEAGNYATKEQNHALATHTSILKKQDGIINFNASAGEVYNLIRGLNPWPVAFTYLGGKTLKIYSATVVDGVGKAGEIIAYDKTNGFIVATSNKALKINELQLEGSKKMSASEFMLGRKLTVGQILGE